MTAPSPLQPLRTASSPPLQPPKSPQITTSSTSQLSEDPQIIASYPVPVILGPTGSGKTSIALELSAALKGRLNLQPEIISADSRAVYRDLDIGTAKPTREEQSLVPHHGLNLVNLNERFTVADWKSYAEQKISEIQSKNHLPIIVGGTGLYIDALIFDYHFRGPTGQRINDFEQKSCSDRTEVKGDFLIIGLKTPREELRNGLRRRIDQMFTPELFKESKKVVQFVKSPATSRDPTPNNLLLRSRSLHNPSPNNLSQHNLSSDNLPSNNVPLSNLPSDNLLPNNLVLRNLPSDNPPSTDPTLKPLFAKAGNIYRFAYAHQNGELSLEEAKEQAFYADYHLAKRQLTWFKRNPAIIWLEPEEVVQFILKKFAHL